MFYFIDYRKIMFGEKNINKFLQKHKDIFGFSIELEWCRLRRTNRHVLKANPGQRLRDDTLYYVVLGFIRECQKLNYFKRLDITGVFVDAEDDEMAHHLNEYWVLKLINDTGNRFIFQADGNLHIKM